MGKIFNTEKVLYFASQEQGLHVSINEPEHTDLRNITQSLTGQGFIESVASDDSGWYFRTTAKGNIELLTMQIRWRKNHGKDVAKHEARLKSLQMEMAS